MNNSKRKDIKGIHYLSIALLAFVGLGLEMLVVLIEPLLYGQQVSFDNWTVMSHWIITCIVWGCTIVFLLKYAHKQYGFQLMEGDSPVKLWQWAAVAALVLLALYSSYQNWGGFKVQKEFLDLGAAKFICQYLYYVFETGLFTIIIVFGQKAMEKWLKHKNIPYGGIICAATWGISHMFTKSSVETGIISAIVGFGFGAVYLLLNRDIRKTFPIVFLMFVL